MNVAMLTDNWKNDRGLCKKERLRGLLAEAVVE